MASLRSVEGNLESLYGQLGAGEKLSPGYKPLRIGEPLVARYLRFFIKFESKEYKNEIMISTYVKTAEEKQGASEAINYYNPEMVLKSGFKKWLRNRFKSPRSNEEVSFQVADFGAQRYAHELIYYTRSYFGESLRLTTKIMELDKVDDEIVKAIREGISTVAGMPAFVEFLPYTALASKGTEIIAEIANTFNEDDVIVGSHDLDLHFKRNHDKKLQSGRIVCIPKRDEGEFLGEYKLRPDNVLVAGDGKEYTASSYYVLQINNEENKLYEKFDHFQRAAELLKKTNRGGDLGEVIDTIVNVSQGYSDMDATRKIEALIPKMDTKDDEKRKEVKEKIKAHYNSMSQDMQKLYKLRMDEILQPENEQEKE